MRATREVGAETRELHRCPPRRMAMAYADCVGGKPTGRWMKDGTGGSVSWPRTSGGDDCGSRLHQLHAFLAEQRIQVAHHTLSLCEAAHNALLYIWARLASEALCGRVVTTLTWNVLQLSSPCALRFRHSQLEDGGGGALVVGVSEEALGVVIELVVLEAVQWGSKQEWGKQEWCTHMRGSGSGHGAWSMAAWGMAEHGHMPGHQGRARACQGRTTLDCRTQRGRRARGAVLAQAKNVLLHERPTYEILVSEAVTKGISGL